MGERDRERKKESDVKKRSIMGRKKRKIFSNWHLKKEWNKKGKKDNLREKWKKEEKEGGVVSKMKEMDEASKKDCFS